VEETERLGLMIKTPSTISYQGNPLWLLRIIRQEGLIFQRRADASISSIEDLPIHIDLEGKCLHKSTLVSATQPKVLFTSNWALAKDMGIQRRRRRTRYFSFSKPNEITLCDSIVAVTPGLRDKGFTEYGLHFDARKNEISGSGIFVGSRNGILIVGIPWDLSRTPESRSEFSKYLIKTYQSGDQVVELSPGVDGAAIREAVFFALKLAHKFVGVNLKRLSPVPEGAPYTIVRIDADGHSERSTDSVLKVSEKLGVPFTWFLDFHSWKDQEQVFPRIAEKSEVGVHCYLHLTFSSRRSNRMNLAIAKKLMEKHFSSISGTVSPHGSWTKGFSKAVSDTKFSYSSEFAASEADFPFFPHGDVGGGTLQIPTPGASLGTWTGKGSYWHFASQSILRQHRMRGVALIYDHPLGRLEKQVEGFETLLSDAISRGDKFITMSEWAAIWREREAYLQQLSSAQGQSQNQLVAPPSQATVPPHFILEELELEKVDFSPESFAGLLKHVEPLKKAEWDVRKSIWIFALGLFPIEAHLLWQKLRGRIISLSLIRKMQI
jgi:hypothetical protein